MAAVLVTVGSGLVALRSPAPARAGTSSAATMVVTAEPSTVIYGTQTVLRGGVSVGDEATASRLPVVVSGRAAGEASFAVLSTVWTDAVGRFALRVTPLQTTTYRAEIGEQGAGEAALPGPVEVLVTVRPRVLFGLPSRVWAGEPVTFRGEVLPRQAVGTVVTVQRRVSGSWRTVAATATDESSRFSVTWVSLRDGQAVFRAALPSEDGGTVGVSRRRVRLIRDPNPHDVPAVLERVIVIDHAAYRLYYYENGRAVRDFPCVLGKPSTPTPLGRGFRIKRKRMNPGGANGARYLGYLGPIGIHGTDQPWLLRRFPRAFSHGCARLYNRDIIWLYDRVAVGTRVWNVRGKTTRLNDGAAGPAGTTRR